MSYYISSGITSEYIGNEVFEVLKHKVEAITHRSRTTPCPGGVDLRNGSRREGEGEHTYKTTSRQSLSN
jgi:hypothetical protein